MIKIARKTKTILLIMGILFFPFLISLYLFPSLATEHFCFYILPNPDAPMMNNELWSCGYSPAMSLIFGPLFFGLFTLIAFLSTIIWTFVKKKPKYIIFVQFSWLFFPFVCLLTLNGILYQLFPYEGMYIESNYNFFIPVLWLMLFSLLWLTPILISSIRYKRGKINKENLQNNIYKWLKWSIYLYIIYAVTFVALAIFSPLFRLYFQML